jgi:hypothetical protein
MKYDVEIVSDAILLIPSFINTDSGIQKIRNRQHGDLISLLLFLQNKRNGLQSKEKYTIYKQNMYFTPKEMKEI